MEMANHKMELLHITVAIVTVLSLCAMCAPANAGVSPDDGKFVGNNGAAIIGEKNLVFLNESWQPSLNTNEYIIPYGIIRSTAADIPVIISFNGPFDSSLYEDELNKTDEYEVTGPNGRIKFYFFPPELDVKTKVCGEVFDWVTKGDNITFEADTNLWFITNLSWDFRFFEGPLPNNITYKLLNPSNVQLYNIGGVSLIGNNVGFDYKGKNSLTINTANLDTGVYTLSIEPDPETNNGLDVEGPEIEFEVRNEGVTIEAEPLEQATNEEITFTVTTTPHTNITLGVTWGIDVNAEFIEGKGNVERGGTSAFGKSDKNGDFKAVAYFIFSGTYEITATEYGCADGKSSTRENTTDRIEVVIRPYEAKVEVNRDPPIFHIGENVEISVSMPKKAGDNITLKINDEVVRTGASVDGFDYSWKTENLAPDSYKIAVWVLPFSDPYRDPPDASITVVLIRGGLFAEPSAPFVALGDKFKIEGIVPGRDRVDILTIAPEGGSGKGFLAEAGGVLDAPGLTYGAYGVDTDGEFETEAIAVGEDVDTGTYLIAALNYGRDGVWGKSHNNNLLEVLSNDYASPLGAKSIDQLLAILKDRTINAAGTDDLLGIATISVEKGFVTLDELEDVPLGKKIEITGMTNRQVDTPIIVTVEGLEETTPKLKPRIAKVKEDDKTFYNTFSISFDTTSTNIGTYEVTADDGDGHTASTTVTILPAEEHSVTVSTTPTPKTEDQEPETGEEAEKPPVKTTTPTPTPTEEPAEQPGFGMPLTIAGLLLAVVVLLRRRNKR